MGKGGNPLPASQRRAQRNPGQAICSRWSGGEVDRSRPRHISKRQEHWRWLVEGVDLRCSAAVGAGLLEGAAARRISARRVALWWWSIRCSMRRHRIQLQPGQVAGLSVAGVAPPNPGAVRSTLPSSLVAWATKRRRSRLLL